MGRPLVKLGDPVAATNTIDSQQLFDGTLNVQDYQFLPARVQMPAGTTLGFQNTGAVVHTATENGGKRDTGDIAPGETKTITFDTAGIYTFTCSPHLWMLGQAVVH